LHTRLFAPFVFDLGDATQKGFFGAVRGTVMGAPSVSRRRLVSVGCFLAILSLFLVAGAAAAAGQPSTPIDGGPDDTGTENGRITPSEQVPFGIRAVYGGDETPTPSGGSNVTVAVVDTGVDTDHPDLRDRVALCLDFTGDRVRERCTDEHGHGTHVAGTIAADGGADGRGIYGVAPEAEIFALKACGPEGQCAVDPLSEAVRTATDRGADIVVLSLGGRSEPRIEAATEYATDRGVAVVAASGNTGPEPGSILYPAAHPNVIAVGAIGPRTDDRVSADNYQVPEFSSRGVEEPFSNESDASIDVAAPGVAVLSPVPDGEYATKTGTSMAAPHVAGLAAKILAGASEPLSPSELRAELHGRAPRYDVTAGRHARAGYDPAAGFGVATVSEPRPAFSVAPEPPVGGEPFVLDASASRSDAPITGYAWDTTGDGAFDRTGESIELETPPGTHPMTLRVTDGENASETVTRDVFVNDRPRVSVIAPETATVGENVTFEAAIENEYGETTATWILPDGTTATGERVTRAFEAGNRTVAVTVTDEFGATATAAATVSVTEPAVEEQGPVVSPAVLVALVVGVFLARRFG
jgi:subtilisin